MQVVVWPPDQAHGQLSGGGTPLKAEELSNGRGLFLKRVHIVSKLMKAKIGENIESRVFCFELELSKTQHPETSTDDDGDSL
jgi:hypothetical protein